MNSPDTSLYATTLAGSAEGIALHMQIVGGNAAARATATEPLPGITNYFIGNDPNQWHTNIASFGRVEYDEVYSGIDMAYYGNNGQLEYDFIVSPGADPSAITLNFTGAEGVEVNTKGDLVVHTSMGDVVHQKPFTYQQDGRVRREVASNYAIEGDTVRFEIGAYDHSRRLVIDPVVPAYSTFLDPWRIGRAISVDSAGNAYVAGYVDLSDQHIFVQKLNATGSALVYSTFIGGTGNDLAFGMAVDASGDAYLTGYTESADFPTTPGAFDTTFNAEYGHGFVTKLNSSGSALSYSTFLAGSVQDFGYGVAVDGGGNAYVAGITFSTDFPTTPNAFDTTHNGGVYDGFVTKLNATGSALTYSTFLGGSGNETDYELLHFGASSIAVDETGNAYVTGFTGSTDFPTTPGAFDTSYGGAGDSFVTKLDASGSGLVYSTFLGGSGDDAGYGIAMDSSGNAYVTGRTRSGNFPTTPGAFDTSFPSNGDAFVTKLNPTGSALVYSTFLGGGNEDIGSGIAVDSSGNVYLTGQTSSANFPTTPGAFQTTYHYDAEVFVSKLKPNGSALSYSTYLGGEDYETGYGIAIDSLGSVYVTGYTASTDFPTTPVAFDNTYFAPGAFVTKLQETVGGALSGGYFQAHTISTFANGASSVFAADIDGDGDNDVLSASNQNEDDIVWYENLGGQIWIGASSLTTRMWP